MKEKDESSVVVVGAGPTGLMLACELRLMGVDVTVIERRSAGTGESRAPGINARTMEIFGQRGLAERFQEKGRSLPAVLFSGIPMLPGEADPGWPDALILPQHQTERLLAERAKELGVAIHWSVEVVHVEQDDDGVTLVVADGGVSKAMRARYVAGCDGGRSAVRRAVGAGFPGIDPVSHWVVADVQLDSPPGEGESFGRNSRIGTYQVSQVEPEWYRVSMMKVTPPTDSSAPVTLDELRQSMLEGLGTDFGLRLARWTSRFSDGFRQVDRYRHGRVFLAGDAAHTHSPIGGQGLNLGVQDGVNLAYKLAEVVRHGASEELLDTYHQERHPVAEGVLEIAKAQTALIKPGPQIEALRQVFARMLEVPQVVHDLAGTLSGLTLRYRWAEGRHPLVGRRMPNLRLATADGDGDVYASMHSAEPLLLTFDSRSEFALAERRRSRVKHLSGRPGVDRERQAWRLPVLGAVPAIDAAFVRPDGYVAWVSPTEAPASVSTLEEALTRWLG